MYKSKNQPGSRTQMLQWINRTLNINQTRIENLATGVVYCMILNNFHPNIVQPSKIIMNPKSHHQYRTNLRRFQEGLSSLEIRNISFDVFKVSDMTYAENWNLVCKLYRQFNGLEKEKSVTNENKWQQKVEMKTQTPFSKNPSLGVNPLSTPMKHSKMADEGGKIRWQTMNMIEEIKRIVAVEGVTDRIKVEQLRHMLGLQDEDGAESEADLKDLLSDYKKKQEIINID